MSSTSNLVTWSERANFRPEKANFRPERTGNMPERADFRPERRDSRPERADFRPERADFRPGRADFRPERAWGGRTNGWTDEQKSPCVLQEFVSFGTAAQKNGYTATPVACGWSGAVPEKVTRESGQEPYAQKAQKRQKCNSRKSIRWSAVPIAPM